MAKITLGSIIGSISGSIGSVTFQQGRFGMVARQKPYPYKTNSSKASLYTSQFFYLAKYWRSLTDSQKNDWVDYAATVALTNRYGGVYYITGYNMFVLCNSNRLLCGLSVLITPVVYPSAIVLLPPQVDLLPTFINLLWSPAIDFGNKYIQIWATSPMLANLGTKSSDYRMLQVVQRGSTSTVNILSNYIAVFPNYSAYLLQSDVYVINFRLTAIDGDSGFAQPFISFTAIYP